MADKTCPNCGKLILRTDGYCAHCGLKLAAGKSVAMRIFSLVALLIVGLPAALAGGCGLVFTFAGGVSGLSALPIALIGFAAFGGILAWFLGVWRKP